jgi:chemotaxis response regulator CheB
MPKAAADLGAARDICALEAMADTILRRLSLA